MTRENLSQEIYDEIKRLTPSERDALLHRYMLAERTANVDEPCCELLMERNDAGHGHGVSGWYDVIVADKDGHRKIVDFGSRLEKLLYVMAMRHATGYRRYALVADGGKELLALWDELFNHSNGPLLDMLDADDFDHKVSNAVSRSRRAVEKALEGMDNSRWYKLVNKNGKLFIPLLNKAA